jgi:uncharacterized GH25 family protein
MGTTNLRGRVFFLARLAILLTVAVLIPGVCKAQDSQSPSDKQGQQSSPEEPNKDKAADAGNVKLHIKVLTDSGKPLANASVYVRFNVEGTFLHHDKQAEMNFKTNQDGSVKVPEIPQGKVLIQVIAPGWHTYGKWYDENKTEDTIEIKLVPPPHWY